MKKLSTAVAVLIATPALAQTTPAGNHTAHGTKGAPAGQATHTMSAKKAPAASACTPEHAAMGHCKLAKPAKPAADPHAAHGKSPKK